ncbi:MAG: DNA methyltransferase [Akkermansia muciniphila]
MAVTLGQNEISARAAKFAEEWKDTEREEAEAQSFLIDFFSVLGVSRKRVAIFEHKVQCADGSKGYIDLFWKGHILIEMKSRGKDLAKAYEQAKRYADTLAPHEFPHGILVCDFENWHYYDLDHDAQCTCFRLAELPQYIHLFHYLAGYEQREYQEEDPVNVQAAELLGRLHDRLKAIGYVGHPLEVYLVRLLFCLFAEDTGIFRKDAFHRFLLDCTSEDGRDLAARLAELFQTLNTPEAQRLCLRDAAVNDFPYVNGGLFAEFLPMPAFDTAMRSALLDCCTLDWGRISPAIFGSMFQSVMNAEERRALGAHYTSERNILKLINPLFMDALREEFAALQHDKSNRKITRLQAFHRKLASLTFLDPACGCGNFLIIAYRELRRLELSLIAELEQCQETAGTAWLLSANDVCLVNVNQFYGIELEEFPAQIAQVAMWLMDHLMNIEAGNHFGEAYARIPLTASATIVRGNALRIDWESVVPKEKLSYILGNPPFIGYTLQTKEQKDDLSLVWNNSKGSGVLDYVCAWYKKAVDFMQDTHIETAFVSTNSITQGEQVPVLWEYLLSKRAEIRFAWRTFKWSNEAKGVAAVHCVIIGFSLEAETSKRLAKLYSDEQYCESKEINGYLVAASQIIIRKRTNPISPVPNMVKGSQPTDNGFFFMNDEEKNELLSREPQVAPFIKKFLGAKEFLHSISRWCLWLVKVTPATLRSMPLVMDRVQAVKEYRGKSTKAATRKSADTPSVFQEIRQPEQGDYLLIPRHSSENRAYIPFGFLTADIICGDANLLIPNASRYHFGVISSAMHMAWVRTVAGRIKSDYRYSGNVVYNNFPWPECTEAQQEKIAELAQGVLDARAQYPDSSLADLYDPLTMPPELVAAHRKLDSAVEKAYGRKFTDDAERVAFLFEKYSELTK